VKPVITELNECSAEREDYRKSDVVVARLSGHLVISSIKSAAGVSIHGHWVRNRIHTNQ
jgi:hypothetical protein